MWHASKRKEHRILVRKSEGKGPFGRNGCRWEE
jgi:hypothetical protein